MRDIVVTVIIVLKQSEQSSSYDGMWQLKHQITVSSYCGDTSSARTFWSQTRRHRLLSTPTIGRHTPPHMPPGRPACGNVRHIKRNCSGSKTIVRICVTQSYDSKNAPDSTFNALKSNDVSHRKNATKQCHTKISAMILCDTIWQAMQKL